MLRPHSPRSRVRTELRASRKAALARKKSLKKARKASAKAARRKSRSPAGGVRERVHMANLRMREAMRRRVTVHIPKI